MPQLTDQDKRSERLGHPEEEETETTGGKPIKMNTFVYSNVKWWVEQAQGHRDTDQPMLAFISAWIAFNHCYGLFWAYRSRELLKGKSKITITNLSGTAFSQDFEEYVPDNYQIAAFIGKRNPGFEIFWRDFVATKGTDLVQKITLPVTDLARLTEVPDSEQRKVRLVELEISDLFRVLLTIRNNLFHGGKKVTESRHVDVSSCAAEFMVPFITELTKNIEGAG